jgi:hypothetical protein
MQKIYTCFHNLLTHGLRLEKVMKPFNELNMKVVCQFLTQKISKTIQF